MNVIEKERRIAARPLKEGQMDTSLVFITPKIAEEWLKLNTRNRNLTGNVATIAREWQERGPKPPSHQGIAFYASDGALADGQTRLTACVKSGVPFWQMVTWGLPEEAASEIDRHRPRSDSDSIKIGRLSDWIGAKELSLIKMIANAHQSSPTKKSNVHLVEIGDFIRPHIEFTLAAFGNRREKHITVSPVLAAVAIAFSHEDEYRLLEFAEVLLSGMPESHDDVAAVRLRDGLLQQGAKTGQTAQKETLRRTMRAIKAFCERQHIKKLYTPSELIYRIEGLEELL